MRDQRFPAVWTLIGALIGAMALADLRGPMNPIFPALPAHMITLQDGHGRRYHTFISSSQIQAPKPHRLQALMSSWAIDLGQLLEVCSLECTLAKYSDDASKEYTLANDSDASNEGKAAQIVAHLRSLGLQRGRHLTPHRDAAPLTSSRHTD